VIATYADANMKNIVRLMLEKKCSVYDDFTDESIIKAYHSWDSDNPIRGLVPTGTLGGPRPPNVNFLLYSKPDENDISHLFYFPAWFNKITITGIPNDATYVNVTLFNSAGNRVKWKHYSVSSPSMNIENLNTILFRANGTPTIQIGAYDTNENEQATAQSKEVISAGGNLKQIDLSVV
jgi:hypothetical protein